MTAATVNYSVPENIKREFNKTFAHDNKSQIIASLMSRAIEEHKLQLQRKKAIHKLLTIRQELPMQSAKKLLTIRQDGRK
ncbi:MAG: hypothetical protein K2X50_01805 [Gammaproteobacteria bacterium]|nr:hypothetical protein [Gammaproteobacteria bacterium]